MSHSNNLYLVFLVIGEAFLSILMFSGSAFYKTFQNKAYYLNIDFFYLVQLQILVLTFGTYSS